MEFKKYSKDLDRTNYFKNISLRTTDHCIKAFDSDEISEEEEKCLRDSSLFLHKIVGKNEVDKLVIYGHPSKLI